MKYLPAILLLCACKGTDAAPDEFSVQFGHGDTNGSELDRIDSDTDWVAVGWTWYIGEPQRPLWRTYEAAPAPPADSQPKEPEPSPIANQDEGKPTTPEPFKWTMLLPYLPGVGLAILAALFKQKHT